ncbi:MAG TPA: ABC transporter ATP-binding protein [Vicinamibacteria bacterium]|jgi:ATP-binding cassette subfamily B multidrug efflux pump|nr:ABC transporter ATP-binding protein [Vicinamibacteria bacterium]
MSAAGFHEDDPVAPKSYDWKLLVRLLKYLGPYKAAVAVSFLLILVMAGLDLVGPYLTKVAIDGHIAKGDAAGLRWVAGLYLLALLAGLGVRFAQMFILQMTGQRVMQDMRREIFGHLQRLHVAYFDKNPVGRLMTRVTTDVDAVNELFTSGVVTVFGDLFTLFGIMGVMLALDLRLALVTFAVIPLFFLLTNWFRKGARESFRETRRWVARINAFLQENLSGMSVVQLFRREERNTLAFAAINRKHADANMTAIFYYAVFYPAIELLAALAIALIILYGGEGVLRGTVTLGVLVAFIQYSERFWRPISDLSEKFNILQAAMASSERIFLLLDTEAQVAGRAGARALPEVAGRVAFEGVWFAYSGQEWVLKDIDFAVEPGRSVALVGATGAGKTSIISLLTRFYDVARGRITLDGVDIRELPPAQLRSSLALVLQDVHLFSGTIASNIRLGSAIPEERVREAARAVHAHHFIEALPQGYETEVKERGATLSVGQKQLLSFARALAHDPQVLVLDEATSSVDTETEQLIQDALRVLLKGRTAIVIAHRLSTIQNVDEILVMHKGRIRERGTHQELLAERGLYWRLYQLQYKDQELRVSGPAEATA